MEEIRTLLTSINEHLGVLAEAVTNKKKKSDTKKEESEKKENQEQTENKDNNKNNENKDNNEIRNIIDNKDNENKNKSEENNCRNRFLLEYFGEEIKTECGHCDICEEKNKQQSITKEIKNKLKNVFTITNQKTSQQKETINNIKRTIIKYLRENGKTHPFNLNMEDYDTELIRQAMNELVEENTIRMDENLWIELIQRQYIISIFSFIFHLIHYVFAKH